MRSIDEMYAPTGRAAHSPKPVLGVVLVIIQPVLDFELSGRTSEQDRSHRGSRPSGRRENDLARRRY